ncbi:MAG: NADPH-dependent F420 reductase [Anaerolineae bacterium CG_4_9_14_3_um_filter_57_17]|nr:NADPH-dependent F420 reductase [bacterium]NCT22086.1 NADPH-dependent F420 reductase [bacterium]OIO83806.1 MAG: NADPH-dependent F420 reductase [Anaerolineae bacterium CG2_30_57_67]PJB66817.1 MAG: NADPH-dependent F420 reductase [Anaerolineae bacterium CG_4_9_14_3_um_filter_57_17]
MTNQLLVTIAVLGGTGKEGKGLAYRWAKAGYRVLIGSRTAEKAQSAAQELTALLGEAAIEGLDNLSAAQKADIVVAAVPYAAHRETLLTVKDALQGKLLVDVTVPLVPPKVSKVQMPPAGSAAQEALGILGEGAQVVDAFQNISYEHLMAEGQPPCDVLVTGSSKAAREEALKLVEAAGLTGWDAGPIENSVVVEGLTSVLIYMNKQYGSTHAGIKITGIHQ